MVTHIGVVKLLHKVSGYSEGTLCSICKVDFCFEKSFEFLHSSLKRSLEMRWKRKDICQGAKNSCPCEAGCNVCVYSVQCTVHCTGSAMTDKGHRSIKFNARRKTIVVTQPQPSPAQAQGPTLPISICQCHL